MLVEMLDRQQVEVYMTGPATLTAVTVEQAVNLTPVQVAAVQAHHDRMRGIYGAMPPRDHHNHEPLREINPF